MRIFTELRNRIGAFFRNRGIAKEVDAEMQQHLEFMIEDYIAEGMSPQAARRKAMMKFGNVEKHKEDARDAWGNRVLLDFIRNFRFGLRLCGRYPESSVLAIIVLALGIGIASVIFTASSQFMQLNVGGKIDDQQVYLRWQGKDRKRRGPSTQELDAMEQASRSMERLVGIHRNSFSFHPYDREEEERQIDGAMTSANFFQLAQDSPAIGRTFLPDDLIDEENAPVVISDSLWNEFYDRSPSAVGSVAIVNGQQRRIVGVMPQGFAFPRTENIWLPSSWREFASLPAKDAPWIDVYGTVKEGVTIMQAQEELRSIVGGFLSENSDPKMKEGEFRLVVSSLRNIYVGMGPMVILSLGSTVALLVLLLCASNVFHVIMARTARRAHELATRCSLGAPRSHVVAQVLVDGVTLALLGAVLGLGLAKFGLDALSQQLLVFDLGEAMDLQMTPRVIWFALGAAIFTGSVAALVPAWRACRIDAFAVLKDDAPGAQGIHASRLSRNLLTFQVGCSALLLWIGLVAFGELSLVQKLEFPFNTDEVLTAKLRLRYDPGLRKPEAVNQFRERLERRLQAVPGVQGVAFSSADHAFFGDGTRVDHDAWDPAVKKTAQVEVVSPGLLEVYGMSPVSGRMINGSDTKDARKVMRGEPGLCPPLFPGGGSDWQIVAVEKTGC